MKVKNLIIALVVIPILGFAMGQPHDTIRPSDQTLKAAQSAGKPILVISGPDADMAAGILGNRHTSRFLDTHFVIEQQLGTDEQGMYSVYNEQGELVHRVAHEAYPYELAVKIKRALDPETQYYPALARFENGDRSADLLENLIVDASDAGDHENVNRLIQAYLETGISPVAEGTIRLLAKHTSSSSDPGFAVLMADMAAADAVLGTGKTAEKLAAIIFDEAFAPHLTKKNVDLNQLTEEVKSAYPDSGLSHLIDGMPIRFLEMREDWAGLEAALPAYLSAHSDLLTESQLNYYAWLGAECLKNSERIANNN